MAKAPENKNMELWDKVCKTDPQFVKPVSYGARNFSAIDAYSQIREATKLWGPMGDKWGYRVSRNNVIGDLLVVELHLYYPGSDDKKAEIGPVIGAARFDLEAGKKAVTDALTKALSYLGFSADVFLGQFDDNRYTEPPKPPPTKISKPVEAKPAAAKPTEPPADARFIKLADAIAAVAGAVNINVLRPLASIVLKDGKAGAITVFEVEHLVEALIDAGRGCREFIEQIKNNLDAFGVTEFPKSILDDKLDEILAEA